MTSALDIAAQFVKAHEGCKLTAYKDLGGIWTCGWGATGPDIHEGTVWSQEAADARLLSDLANAQAGVRRQMKVAIALNQEAALVSFVFNLGESRLKDSTLLHLLNQGDELGAAEQFPRWSNAGGRKIKGLLKRRFEEAALFLT